MKSDHVPKEPESRLSSHQVFRLATFMAGFGVLVCLGAPRDASAQDLLSALAQAGMQIGYSYVAPRCHVDSQPWHTIGHVHVPRTPPPSRVPAGVRYDPPARNVNVQVYPPPGPPRSVYAQVWPEPRAARRSVYVRVAARPLRKPVGTYANGGYVLGGSVPARQPIADAGELPGYPPPAQDVSPTQEALRGR